MTLPTLIAPRPSIDISHHRIHEGNHFFIHRIATGLPIVPKYFLIIPPPIQPDGSVIEMHLILEVSTDNVGGTLEFFENPIVSSNGTPVPIINNNRRSTTTSQVFVFEDPTVASDGTQLFVEIGGTTTTGAELGEFDRNEEELILNPTDIYVLKFTPLAAGANLSMELNWYDNRPSSPVPIPPFL